MKISEGDDNLIKCNRISSESATAESLSYLTQKSFLWLRDKQNL